MRAYALYEITLCGQPVYPEFVSKTKQGLKWYLEYRANNHKWFSIDDYYIKEIDIPVRKLGVRKERKILKIVEAVEYYEVEVEKEAI